MSRSKVNVLYGNFYWLQFALEPMLFAFKVII